MQRRAHFAVCCAVPSYVVRRWAELRLLRYAMDMARERHSQINVTCRDSDGVVSEGP